MCDVSGRVTANDLSAMNEGRWQPERTNDYGEDCRRGREIADEMMDLIARAENPTIAGSVMRAITEAGVYEGIEAGFCSTLGIFIMVNR